MPQTAVAPFRQFVLKVHSRCDLACDHCYMYEFADQSWRGRPLWLTQETVALIGRRVAEHARAHNLEAVRFILHGGEPLLAGPARLRSVIEELRGALDGIAAVDLRIHTNGVRLDEQFCDLFVEHDVAVGISLDGDRDANDRHRRYADGRTSHPRVLAALALLRRPEYRRIFAGILCTIDIANDPITVYEALRAEEPPRIDLLLPHATWDAPPPRPSSTETGQPLSRTAYADWLIRIYDRWTRDGRPFGIRIFDSVHSTLRGGPALTEALGLNPSDLLVFETDGAIEQVDSLKIAFDGAPATGMSVLDSALDLAAEHAGVVARRTGLAGLSAQCRACPVVSTCGGGLYPHRYRAGTGFDNPSVYCDDLLRLINYITDAESAVRVDPAPRHAISAPSMRSLAGGLGDAKAIAELIQTQHSINRLLLAEAAARAVELNKHAGAAWSILRELDSVAPNALRDTIAHPYFRPWAARIVHGDTSPATAGRLAAVALATAVRAGAEVELETPTADDAVSIPGIGRFLVGAGTRVARVATSSDALAFRLGSDEWLVPADASVPTARTEPRWQPTDTLRSSGLSVLLEDTDPERDCHPRAAATRLDDRQRATWHDRFDSAWRLIQRDHPAYAPALAEGLTTITPLSTNPRSTAQLSRNRVFGAVGTTLPADADQLALEIVLDFQKVKFDAVLDLYDLYDASDQRLFHSPLRNEPRPLAALFRDAYAQLAVVDFWRVRSAVDSGAQAEKAERRFAAEHACAVRAARILDGSGTLTAIGLQFAEGMRSTLAQWAE